MFTMPLQERLQGIALMLRYPNKLFVLLSLPAALRSRGRTWLDNKH